MQITILTVPDCPNAPVITERIMTALDGQVASIDLVEIDDERLAVGWGMAGSPTVLVDGIDPFAAPGTTPSVSCRLYRSADGAIAGAPTVDELRRVLVPSSAGREPDGDLSPLDLAGRGGQGRLAPVHGGLRLVQQAVLRSLGTTGRLPDAAHLDRLAAEFACSGIEILNALAAGDFLTLDESGGIRAAYPFSVAPTRHRVVVDGGPSMWSMCAIDALGIAPMLGRGVSILSLDPVTGAAVTILATPTATTWDPTTAVVFAGRRGGLGPAETVCCGSMNFFASRSSASRWAALNPQFVGVVLEQGDAADLGRGIFGHLLEPDA